MMFIISSLIDNFFFSGIKDGSFHVTRGLAKRVCSNRTNVHRTKLSRQTKIILIHLQKQHPTRIKNGLAKRLKITVLSFS